MKSTQFLKEGFVEDANEVHADHEVQMARADLFHAAEDALSLHKMLRNVSEQQGLEGWVAAKITLAADYLKTVREHVEYQLMSGSNDVIAQTSELPIAESEEAVTEGAEDFADIYSPEAIQIGKKFCDAYGITDDNDVQLAVEIIDSYLAYAKETNTPVNLNDMKRQVADAFREVYRGLGKGPSFRKKFGEQDSPDELSETTAGSVATVVNPTPKNKAKVGSLFGGTYKQKNTK